MNNITSNRRQYLSPSKMFLGNLKRYNRLEEFDFERLVFYPGMLFGADYKWWGDRRKRDKPHEGIDICFYRTVKGDIRLVGPKFLIPAMFAGKAVKIIDDYLGKSVFVRHDVRDGQRRQLYTIYGHAVPSENLLSGTNLHEGEIIGTIGDTGEKSVMSHLHISLAWIPVSINLNQLDWKLIGDPAIVRLIDPLGIIACPYSVEPQV